MSDAPPLNVCMPGRKASRSVRPCALLLVVDVPIADMGPSADSHIKAASLASGSRGPNLRLKSLKEYSSSEFRSLAIPEARGLGRRVSPGLLHLRPPPIRVEGRGREGTSCVSHRIGP